MEEHICADCQEMMGKTDLLVSTDFCQQCLSIRINECCWRPVCQCELDDERPGHQWVQGVFLCENCLGRIET